MVVVVGCVLFSETTSNTTVMIGCRLRQPSALSPGASIRNDRELCVFLLPSSFLDSEKKGGVDQIKVSQTKVEVETLSILPPV